MSRAFAIANARRWALQEASAVAMARNGPITTEASWLRSAPSGGRASFSQVEPDTASPEASGSRRTEERPIWRLEALGRSWQS